MFFSGLVASAQCGVSALVCWVLSCCVVGLLSFLAHSDVFFSCKACRLLLARSSFASPSVLQVVYASVGTKKNVQKRRGRDKGWMEQGALLSEASRVGHSDGNVGFSAAHDDDGLWCVGRCGGKGADGERWSMEQEDFFIQRTPRLQPYLEHAPRIRGLLPRTQVRGLCRSGVCNDSVVVLFHGNSE